jgi:hypothetical protein
MGSMATPGIAIDARAEDIRPTLTDSKIVSG